MIEVPKLCNHSGKKVENERSLTSELTSTIQGTDISPQLVLLLDMHVISM